MKSVHQPPHAQRSFKAGKPPSIFRWFVRVCAATERIDGDPRCCGSSDDPATPCPAPAAHRAEVPSYRAAAGGHYCREDWVCPAPVDPPAAAVAMGAHCREDWVCRDPVSPQGAAAWAADWAGADAVGLWV